jgi:hypothetical protein
MEIHLDFTKPSISTNVGKFILDNLNSEKEKESMSTILRGKKLQYGDANVLLRRILTAMIISDGEEEQEIALEGSELIEEVEPLTPPIEITTPTHPQINVEKKEPKEICHFYTINKCKFGKDCRKGHPKICIKFKKFGLKKFNKSGCEENCENFHPKACFEAMKTKTCKRINCKFFHISGTKKEEGALASSSSSIKTSNTFSPVASSYNRATTKGPSEAVFQKEKEPWELAIEKMSAQIKLMMRWQQMQMHNQENLNCQKNNYLPSPNLRPQANWPAQPPSQSQSQFNQN